MIVTPISNHVQAALNRLMQQYQGLPRLEAIVTGLVDQIQDLEDAIYALDQGRQLFNGTIYPAVGAQLDVIGDLVGLKRNGLGDPEYLILILGTIAENNSDSTNAALLNIVATVFQATDAFVKSPNSPNPNGVIANNANALKPANIAFGAGSSQVTDSSLFALIQQIIANSIGAAIKMVYLTTFNSGGAFSYAGPQAWVAGYGAYSYAPNPTVGGGFAKLIYSNRVF